MCLDLRCQRRCRSPNSPSGASDVVGGILVSTSYMRQRFGGRFRDWWCWPIGHGYHSVVGVGRMVEVADEWGYVDLVERWLVLVMGCRVLDRWGRWGRACLVRSVKLPLMLLWLLLLR